MECPKPIRIKHKGKKLERKLSISSLKKKCWNLFSQYIRLRDCKMTTGCPAFGLCFTCDKRYHFKLLQAGHFVPGRHNSNLFSEKGTHAQCYNCNINLHGNTLEYRRRVIAMYGPGTDEELEAEARVVRKYTVFELQEKILYLEKLLEEV
jgi:hypothetical protein